MPLLERKTDTCVICCYFNPNNSKVRFQNFVRFYRAMRLARVPVYVIEMVLPGDEPVMWNRVRNLYALPGTAVMWQKERLLNRLVALLPPRYTKVAWVDVDMIFDGGAARWLQAVSDSLEDNVLVQAFDHVTRLPRSRTRGTPPDRVEGMVARWVRQGRPGQVSAMYAEHGHTGYAWAARRSFLESCGLYDSCLSGSGDHLMAHAYIGDLDSKCFRKVFRGNEEYEGHFRLWAGRAAQEIGGRIGHVPVDARHLWHGAPEKRQYRVRDAELTDGGFDPARHLSLDSHGNWGWTAEGRRFEGWALNYFAVREEP